MTDSSNDWFGKSWNAFKNMLQSSDGESGTLSLEFDVQEDGLLLDFVYQGPYNREQLEQAVEENLLSKVNPSIHLSRVNGKKKKPASHCDCRFIYKVEV